MAITETDFQNIRVAVSAYSDEAYTTARKISGTALVDRGANILITNQESYIGQLRWFKPLSPVINVVSLTNPTPGTGTDVATDLAKYIKTMRAHGAEQVNLQRVISQEDGLAKIGRDFGNTQAQDEHNAVLSVLKGVAQAEADRITGTGTGLVDYDTDPDLTGVDTNGFFVDINAQGIFGDAAVDAVTARKLYDDTAQGAARFARLFKAVGRAWKDYEPPYMYLLTTPEMMAELRVANLVDSVVVQDGNLVFETIFNGKFRLIPTRANQGDYSSHVAVNAWSTSTSFVIGPGAVAFKDIALTTEERVEFERAASTYNGGGSTSVWYRWGYVAHPSGYNWGGSETQFASDADYAATGSFIRKISALNLSILPIFHA